MRRAPHPALIAVAALTYLFLVGPIVIVVGAAFSDTTFLTFPPQGLTLRWFANAWETTAFRSTFLTSLQVAALATTLALLLGVPAAYALARHRSRLPPVLATVFVLPILVPRDRVRLLHVAFRSRWGRGCRCSPRWCWATRCSCCPMRCA